MLPLIKKTVNELFYTLCVIKKFIKNHFAHYKKELFKVPKILIYQCLLRLYMLDIRYI